MLQTTFQGVVEVLEGRLVEVEVVVQPLEVVVVEEQLAQVEVLEQQQEQQLQLVLKVLKKK